MSVSFVLFRTAQICSPFTELPTKVQKLVFGHLRVNTDAGTVTSAFDQVVTLAHQVIMAMPQAALIQTVYTNY